MPHKRNPIVAERICGLARVVRAAAAVGLENVALWHERDISHSRAERVVLPDAFLALDYMLDRFAWLVDGLVVDPERMRRNLEASHGLVFSQRVLLALVERGLPRDEAYRLVQRTRCAPGTRSATSAGSSRPTTRSRAGSATAACPARSTSATRCDTSTPSSSASTRSRRKEEPFMPETAVHVASGKVRELFELDDERLLLVASDRISTFDVVLPTEIPDKGRVLTGLSGFWFARTREIVPNHLLGLRPTAARPRRGGSRCCRSSASSAATWPAPAGRTTGDRRRLRAPAPGGPARVGAAARADLHAGDEGAEGPRREHRREQAAELVGAERLAEVERVSLELYRWPTTRPTRDHPRRHEVRVRPRRRRRLVLATRR